MIGHHHLSQGIPARIGNLMEEQIHDVYLQWEGVVQSEPKQASPKKDSQDPTYLGSSQDMNSLEDMLAS
eukprot:12430653-Karenia_brevis.AAC.1